MAATPRMILPAVEDPAQHPLFRLYRRLLRGDSPDGLEAAAQDMGVARQFLLQHDAQGLFAQLPDDPAWRQLREMAQDQLRRVAASNLELFLRRDALAAAFTEQGIPFAWIKGMTLNERLYPNAGWRRSSDLDVLVPLDRHREALSVAHALGWSEDSRSDAISERTGKACLTGGGPMLELHWWLTHRVKFPIPRDLFAAGWVDHERHCLKPAPEWLYLAAHNAQHLGLVRLIWILDLLRHPGYTEAACRNEVMALAQQTGLRRTVAFSFSLAAALCGDAPPACPFAAPLSGEFARRFHAYARSLDYVDLDRRKLSYYWGLMDRPGRQMPLFLADFAWRKVVGGT